jgi:hypothetical protein
LTRSSLRRPPSTGGLDDFGEGEFLEPLAVVRDIYAALGLTMKEEAAVRMKAFIYIERDDLAPEWVGP